MVSNVHSTRSNGFKWGKGSHFFQKPNATCPFKEVPLKLCWRDMKEERNCDWMAECFFLQTHITLVKSSVRLQYSVWRKLLRPFAGNDGAAICPVSLSTLCDKKPLLSHTSGTNCYTHTVWVVGGCADLSVPCSSLTVGTAAATIHYTHIRLFEHTHVMAGGKWFWHLSKMSSSNGSQSSRFCERNTDIGLFMLLEY